MSLSSTLVTMSREVLLKALELMVKTELTTLYKTGLTSSGQMEIGGTILNCSLIIIIISAKYTWFIKCV